MKFKLFTALLTMFATMEASGLSRVVDLRTLGMDSPLGIESTPTFSWKIDTDERGFLQHAYEITVSNADGQTMWNSGRILSSRQTDILYDGAPLQSRCQYTWDVNVYDCDDRLAATGSSSFETGILTQEEWSGAQWIAPKQSPYKAIVNIYPSNGPVESRFVKINVTASGPHAAADPNYGFVQLAEVEIYNKEGVNVARNATFSATNAWELTNYGWSIKYINDGIIAGGATNGFTTTQNVTATTIIADLGHLENVARIVLYPRQDAPAVNNSNIAANFPKTYTVETATGDDYAVMFSAKNADAPEYVNDTNIPYIGCNFQSAIGKTVKSARLYASALGVFSIRINGMPVTENLLEPGESAYDKHILYSTYDVTPLIAGGLNTIIAHVAGGIANMSTMSDRFVKPELAANTATTSLRAMLYITYTDGSADCITTDDNWGTRKSPTTGSNWYGGEDYDARMEIDGLFTPGYDLSGWERCRVVSPTFSHPAVSTSVNPIGSMRAREYAPLRVIETWPAVSVTLNSHGNYLVDFGENFAGTYSFSLKAPEGTVITLYDSELQEDNACKFEYMYQPAGASNKTLDKYTFKGNPDGETWGPEFMYHGFRYLEICGLPYEPSPSDFIARRIRSNVASVGSFVTGNTLLNDIHRICYNGIQSQLYNTVTDCPHREKLGWLDVPNMMYQSLSYNFDVKSILNKVVMDAFDSQGTSGYVPSTVPHFMRAYDDDLNWGGAAITIPWRNYKQYGDMTLMTQYYDQMKKLITYYGSLTDSNGIIRNDYSVLSDWGQETSGLANHTSSSFTLTCTYYYLLNAMSEMAQALGHESDANEWIQKAAMVKEAFNKRFYKDGVYEFGNQANYGMALYYGLVEEGNIEAVANALAESVRQNDYNIKTGEIGLRPTLMALADNGYNDVVYRMACKTSYPGYGYWVKQGATTSPEYWDMSLSQNHCMMDHIEEWFFSELGGIKSTSEAYETLSIRPWIPADLTTADISVVSPRGLVRMAWNTANSEYRISVPPGSVANVSLPIGREKRLYESSVELSAIPSVSNVEYTDSLVNFTLGSGNYLFTTDPVGGIDTVQQDLPALTPEYYSTMGIRLPQKPGSGLVICKEGTQVRKIIVK